MPQAVIFDLDGTLVDHVGARNVALDAGLGRLGLAAASANAGLLADWHELERRHMDEYLAGACTFDEQRRRRLAAFLPLARGTLLDDVSNAAWWREYANDYEAAWRAYEDVAPCFEALARLRPPLKLGVLTNGDGSQQRAKLGRVGVLDQLDGVFVSSEIGVAKPDPRSFLLACAGLDSAPSETLFVGDWLEVDAHAATAAGLVGVWLDRDETDVRPTCLRVTSLREISLLMLERTAQRGG